MKKSVFTLSAYQRSLTHFFSLLFVFSLFIFSGCQNDALTDVVPDGTVEVRHDGSLEGTCSCTYHILSTTGLGEGVGYSFEDTNYFK